MTHLKRLSRVTTPAIADNPTITITTKSGCDSVPSGAQKNCKMVVKFSGSYEYEI